MSKPLKYGTAWLLLAAWLTMNAVLLSGCWDRNEIEETGIVLGIGLDMPSDGGDDEQRRPEISMTHQIALPTGFSEQGGGKTQKKYMNITSEGPIIFDNIRQLATRIDRPPSYEHVRVIVIGEQVARQMDLRNVINFFMRNTETRRSIRVVVAKGRSEPIFSQHKSGQTPAIELREMTENYHKTLRTPVQMTLGNLSEHLTGQHSFVLQRVMALQGESQLSGAAVVKGATAKMVGWLGELETAGLNCLLGIRRFNGVIEGVELESGAMLGYEVRRMKRHIVPIIEGDRISFEVRIKSEGKLREDWANPGDAFDQTFVERAEQATAARIRQLAERALEKTQKQYKVDVVGFGKRLSIDHPAVWRRVKDDWEDRFSRMPVKVKVEVRIQEFGTRGSKRR